MTRDNAYAVAARLKKVHAVRNRIECDALEAGFNALEKDVAAGIVEQLMKADGKQWGQLERAAGQKTFSTVSRLMLINIFRERAGLPPLDNESLGGPSREAGRAASSQEGSQDVAGHRLGATATSATVATTVAQSSWVCRKCGGPVTTPFWSDTCTTCDAQELSDYFCERGTGTTVEEDMPQRFRR